MSSCVGLLQGLHIIIAMRRDEKHWLLSDTDARTYGAALEKALRHLPVKTTQSAIDFTALAICAFNFEMPRIALSSQMFRQQQVPVMPMGRSVPSGPPTRPLQPEQQRPSPSSPSPSPSPTTTTLPAAPSPAPAPKHIRYPIVHGADIPDWMAEAMNLEGFVTEPEY